MGNATSLLHKSVAVCHFATTWATQDKYNRHFRWIEFDFAGICQIGVRFAIRSSKAALTIAAAHLTVIGIPLIACFAILYCIGICL